MMKIQEHIASKKVSFAVCHAVQFTIIFTPFIQATTSLKEAFVSAAKSSPDSLTTLQYNDMSEPAKKKNKNCGSSLQCSSQLQFKSDSHE